MYDYFSGDVLMGEEKVVVVANLGGDCFVRLDVALGQANKIGLLSNQLSGNLYAPTLKPVTFNKFIGMRRCSHPNPYFAFTSVIFPPNVMSS